MGGSWFTIVKYENGAKLRSPVLDTVETNPIGLGTMALINVYNYQQGFCPLRKGQFPISCGLSMMDRWLLIQPSSLCLGSECRSKCSQNQMVVGSFQLY